MSQLALNHGVNAVPYGSTGGVPATGRGPNATPPGARPVEGTAPATSVCTSTTKAGNACTAYPVHGTETCQGHTRHEGSV